MRCAVFLPTKKKKKKDKKENRRNASSWKSNNSSADESETERKQASVYDRPLVYGDVRTSDLCSLNYIYSWSK